MPAKKRHQNHVIESKSYYIIESLLPSEWVIRKMNPDYGIDLEIEIFEKSTNNCYETLGEHIFVQVKGITEIGEKQYVEFPRGDGDYETCIKYVLDTSELFTVERMGAAAPVMLFIVDVNKDEIYYLCLNDYIDIILLKDDPEYYLKDTKTLYIPTKNCISVSDDYQMIKWYSKKAKYYSLFATINKYYDDLSFLTTIKEYEEYSNKYIKQLLRLDVWNTSYVWPLLNYIHKYILKYQEDIVRMDLVKEEGERCFNFNEYPELITENHGNKLLYTKEVWNKLRTLAVIYESVSRKFGLPVWIGY